MLAGGLKMFSFYECGLIVNKSDSNTGGIEASEWHFQRSFIIYRDHFVLKQVEKQVGSEVAVR